MAKQKLPTNQFASTSSPTLVSTNVKILLTLLSGLVLGLLSLYLTERWYVDSVTQRVQTISSLLSTEQIRSLKAGDEHAAASEAALKSQLQAARRVNDDIRFLYLVTISSTNNVSFLVDAETPGSSTYSPKGKQIGNASETLKSAFFTNEVHRESSFRDQSGSWVSWLSPIYDKAGTPIAMLGIDIPVTTYRTVIALAALIPFLATVLIALVFLMTDKIRLKHQESLRLRAELVSIASHELRTPLTGIRWGEESLLDGKLADKNRSLLKSMYDSTLRLQESIEDILQLANWQAGRHQELIRTTTDLTQLFKGIFATQKLPAAQKNVTLEFAKDWPHEVLINCDAQRMKRVLNNLVSNAIKYSTPSTTIIIAHQKIDGQHLISIADHGIGIPKAEQSKVFGGFYRASNAIRQEASGTGMGLYMSRGAIEQHGGKLWLTSEEGKGTTVFIKLP